MWTKFGDDMSKRSWVMLDKTDRLTDRQTDRQTDKPTNEHTCQNCKFWQVTNRQTNILLQFWQVTMYYHIVMTKNGDMRQIRRDFTEITATSFRIMGNIHPNPNHPSESLHVMAHNNHDCKHTLLLIVIKRCFAALMAKTAQYLNNMVSSWIKSRLHLSELWKTSIRIIGGFHDASIRILCPKKYCQISQVTSNIALRQATWW